MNARRLARTVVIFIAISHSALAQTPTFQFLINPAVAPTWANYALSKDGKVMAANYGGRIYRWSADTPKFPSGGFTLLDPGYFLSSSVDISKDGTTIVAARPGPDGYINPAIWNQAMGWTDMGHPANGCVLDGEWGTGYGVSADGAIAVGLAWYCPGGAEGFIWKRTTGMKALSHPSGASSRASAISADGKTVVGFFEDPRYGNRRPVLWLAGKKQLFAGANTPGEATAVSSDGSKIVGQAYDLYSGYAFYYTPTAGLTSLGTVSGNQFDQSVANAVADNGTTVGWSGDPFGGGVQAFIWRPGRKIQSLQRYLQNRGVLIPSGISLVTALDISADASTIVGIWQDGSFNQGGWMVRLKP